MAYGLRQDGGASLIVGLIQDYRNRAERKEVRDQESLYRASRDAESDRRYNEGIDYRSQRDEEMDSRYDDSNALAINADNRQTIVSNRQTDAYNNGLAKEKRLQDSKQSIVDERSSRTEAEYNAAIESEKNAQGAYLEANVLGSTISKGASGTGTGIGLVPEGEERTAVVISTPEGDKPVTGQPNDNSSVRVTIANDKVPEMQSHLEQLEATAAEQGYEAKTAEAYVRAGFFTDPTTGDTRPATPDEMAANLKAQPFLKRKLEETQYTNRFGGEYSKAKDRLREMDLDGDGMSRNQFIDNAERKTLNKFVTAKEGTYLPSLALKPSKLTLNAETSKELLEAKDQLDKSGVSLKQTPEQINQANMSHAEKMISLHTKYKARKQRDAVVAEGLLSGFYSKEEFQNYADTGLTQYSARDLKELSIGDTKSAFDMEETKLQIGKYQAEIAKIKFESDPNSTKNVKKNLELTAAYTKAVGGRIEFAVDKAFGNDDNAEKRKEMSAALNQALYVTMSSQGLSVESMQDAGSVVGYDTAFNAFISSYKNNKVKPTSITPFINSASHKFKEVVGNTVLEIHGGLDPDSGVTEQDIVKKFNTEHEIAVGKYGLELIDQDVIDDLNLDLKLFYQRNIGK